MTDDSMSTMPVLERLLAGRGCYRSDCVIANSIILSEILNPHDLRATKFVSAIKQLASAMIIELGILNIV